MIAYSIDAYRKLDENLLCEIAIPEKNVNALVEIMGLQTEDKADFAYGIGVYNINKSQAHRLEKLIGKEFYSCDLTLQLSGGEVK